MRLWFCLLTAAWLVGCAPGKGGGAGVGVALPADWSPDRVSLVCPSNDCPAGVGLLMFVSQDDSSRWSQRCTASLIGPDRIMTNDHCGHEGDFARAYFIVRGPHGVVYSRLGRRLFGAADEVSGVGRDLAVWQLEKALAEKDGSGLGFGFGDVVEPLRVSRQIPSDTEMRRLEAYVVNGLNGDDADPWRFQIDKRECSTLARMGYVQGGVQDRSIGLALFDCGIRLGNSGGPVFTASDHGAIQAVVNTIWNADPAGDTLAGTAAFLFFQVPEYIGRKFAMAERVQCLSVADLAPPLEVCQPRRSDTELMAQAIMDRLAEEYASVGAGLGPVVASDAADAAGAAGAAGAASVAAGVLWGARAVPMNIGAEERLGVALIPFAVCVSGEMPRAETRVDRKVRYFRLGLDLDGRPGSRFAGEDDIHAVVRRAPDGTDVSELIPEELSDRSRFHPSSAGLLDSLLKRKGPLPKCGDRAVEQDLRHALAAIWGDESSDSGL